MKSGSVFSCGLSAFTGLLDQVHISVQNVNIVLKIKIGVSDLVLMFCGVPCLT